MKLLLSLLFMTSSISYAEECLNEKKIEVGNEITNITDCKFYTVSCERSGHKGTASFSITRKKTYAVFVEDKCEEKVLYQNEYSVDEVVELGPYQSKGCWNSSNSASEYDEAMVIGECNVKRDQYIVTPN